MKIRTIPLSYDEVMALPRPRHFAPHKPDMFFRTLVRLIGAADLRETHFAYTMEDRAKQALRGPCLILMNHSSFIDLEIASRVLYPRPYCIVCTSDGFVGKSWLMKSLGCIPTQKFVTDLTLIRDMRCALKEKNSSVLMYPEASYTFDGCPTPLPRSLGRLLRMLEVPVIMIKTEGAFARDPLYNCLQKRRVRVSARVSCLFDTEQVRTLPAEKLQQELDDAFTFDSFRWQAENGVEITEPFRADGLERILYKCAACGAEGGMLGKGTSLTCSHCGKAYEMDTLGRLRAADGVTEYPHIPDWYRWEREEVRKEIADGTYLLDTDVQIGVMVDYKNIYMVGKGHLRHDREGFLLTGCEGRLEYRQKPQASYGLYSDYFWYELGDMICIGNRDRLYYCFPEKQGVVAKTRMAAEELFGLSSVSLRGSARGANA